MKVSRKNITNILDTILAVLGWIGRAIAFLLRKFIEYFFNILITVILIGIVTGGIVAASFAVYIRDNIDATFDIDAYVADLNQTSFVYYTEYSDAERTNGTVKEMGEIKTSMNRVWATVDPDESDDNALVIPDQLIDAFTAVEDKRFFQHNGVDWIRTGGAMLKLVTQFSKSYGGSTITQQVIKNLTGDDETTIQRKIQEILRALYLERSLQDEYSSYDDPKYEAKKKIIGTYMNTIYLSNSAYGVQAAAQTYFSKNVSELSLVECAAIAAIPQNPYKWDPVKFPENNKVRRNVVLSEMYAQGMIFEDEYREAINTELELKNGSKEDSLNSYFTDYMIECIVKDLMEEKGYTKTIAEQLVYGGGLQIYSTIDPQIQTIMEEEYAKDSNFPTIADGIQPQSAMVIIEPYTGKVLGIVGGRGTKSGSVLNRATNSRRQPGSTIKPLSVYSLGIELGLITEATVLDDSPVNFNTDNLAAWPKNSNRTYRGLTTVKYGLQQSLNTIAVKIMQKVTPKVSFDFLTKELGITTLVGREVTSSGTVYSDIDLSPMSLGALTYGAKLIELANAYCIFPNDGIFTESTTYTKVLDKNGEVLLSKETPAQSEVLTPQTATLMNGLLMNVVNNGTGKAATLKNKIQVAGKTGTTDDNKDLWFIGYTPYLLGGSWFGYDNPKRISGYSTNPSLSIWNTVMTRVHNEIVFPRINESGAKLMTFKTPEETGNIVECEYCIDSGLLPCEACYNDMRGNRIAKGYFTVETVPTKTCDVHVNVAYDVVCGGIAREGCPAENIRTVSLIKYDREFPFYVAVTDAQYTYREVSRDFSFTLDSSKPFYYGLANMKMKERLGYYYGINTSIKNPVNRLCPVHSGTMHQFAE